MTTREKTKNGFPSFPPKPSGRTASSLASCPPSEKAMNSPESSAVRAPVQPSKARWCFPGAALPVLLPNSLVSSAAHSVSSISDKRPTRTELILKRPQERFPGF